MGALLRNNEREVDKWKKFEYWETLRDVGLNVGKPLEIDATP